LSLPVTIGNYVGEVADPERGHRLRIRIAWLVAVALIVAVAAYGWNYYLMSADNRPFSPKHEMLKPSGSIGIKLGFLGVAIFCGIFVYPIRKRIPWLARRGSAPHWLDYHVVLGVTAPIIIAFHSSFKFRGIAGMAFWIMLAVALSGIVGRYLYSQIPRRLNSAELTMKELEEMQANMARQLSEQKLVLQRHLYHVFRLPSARRVQRLPAILALIGMLMMDFARPFHIARLRLRVLGFGGAIVTLGGLLRTNNQELEQLVGLAREKASLAKRMLFLSRTQQVFHLWHVVHRPFSYSFVVLAIIHIGVVMLLGYM
jgi:hypothetical protein